jgi:glutamine cyclotransferase
MKFYFALLALLLCSALANGQSQYRYEVVDTKPQSRENFVQGLEILDGTLYLSSGGYGNSRLSR